MKSIIFFIITVASCYAADIEFSERPRNFSMELLHFTQLETDGHVVISPFGIWTLLTGVSLGAGGKSLKQIQRACRLSRNEDVVLKGYLNLSKTVLDRNTKDVMLTSKNFVFLDRSFSVASTFGNHLRNTFDAKIEKLDFKDTSTAAKFANSLIEQSGATVSNVLKSDDFAESRMILTNVISFKGLWSKPFNTSETNLEKFYDENKNVIGNVNMMYQRAPLPFSNMENLEANIMELPYGNDNKYCMLIILPYPKVSVAQVYNKLKSITIKDIFKRLEDDNKEYGIEDVDLKLPRFKISTNVVLNKPLNDMGVFDIFDPKKANFLRITKEDIYISNIVHKADIEVTETGTVASADTSAYFSDRIATPTFEANRPFIYFVMEKPTTTVIFSGIYSKPSVF